MSAQIPTISVLNQRATDTLIREIGVVDTIRFLNQFRAGSGDYTAERQRAFEGMSAKDIINEIKAQKKGA
ncbi:MAG: hypothetical protein ACREQ8_13965 [Woeseiaceae bacterium]